MVLKEKIKICDSCGMMVSKTTCKICDKDLCEKCEENLKIEVEGLSGGEVWCFKTTISYCRNCFSRIGAKKSDFWDEKLQKKLKNELETFIRKKIIVEELEDKKDG